MYSVTEHLIKWLADKGYKASTYPSDKDRPPFVTVDRTGGRVRDLVDHPVVAIQTWAKTEAEAEEMAINIRDSLLLEERPYGVSFVAVNSGPYPFWDQSTRCPRYQIVLDITTQLTD